MTSVLAKKKALGFLRLAKVQTDRLLATAYALSANLQHKDLVHVLQVHWGVTSASATMERASTKEEWRWNESIVSLEVAKGAGIKALEALLSATQDGIGSLAPDARQDVCVLLGYIQIAIEHIHSGSREIRQRNDENVRKEKLT